jgi:hypothetical protein
MAFLVSFLDDLHRSYVEKTSVSIHLHALRVNSKLRTPPVGLEEA